MSLTFRGATRTYFALARTTGGAMGSADLLGFAGALPLAVVPPRLGFAASFFAAGFFLAAGFAAPFLAAGFLASAFAAGFFAASFLGAGFASAFADGFF